MSRETLTNCLNCGESQVEGQALCPNCGTRCDVDFLSNDDFERFSKYVCWEQAILAVLLSGALFWLGGYLLALIGPIACFWFFARSWEKQPRRRALSFVQNHSLSMLVMVLYCVLLGCSVCVGGPIYLGSHLVW
jgi:hypothetical protein